MQSFGACFISKAYYFKGLALTDWLHYPSHGKSEIRNGAFIGILNNARFLQATCSIKILRQASANVINSFSDICLRNNDSCSGAQIYCLHWNKHAFSRYLVLEKIRVEYYAKTPWTCFLHYHTFERCLALSVRLGKRCLLDPSYRGNCILVLSSEWAIWI